MSICVCEWTLPVYGYAGLDRKLLLGPAECQIKICTFSAPGARLLGATASEEGCGSFGRGYFTSFCVSISFFINAAFSSSNCMYRCSMLPSSLSMVMPAGAL